MRLNQKKIIVLVTTLFISLSSWAMSLSDAKSKGLVGEQRDGYLGVVVDSSEARSVVRDINAKRKAIYIELANKNGVAVDVVAKLAGEKAIAKTQSGHYIKNAMGKWQKK
ncbi:MAG: DUF1318 domain-containing protein [Alteromonadaceae bacterium]|nr:DUF1318 domain-containing protein [Alteromonadaceae bacterium]